MVREPPREQCAARPYSFIVHGLWPQYSPQGYPQFCSTPAHLTGEAVLYAEKVFPSPGLISHEWSKHGTCSGMSALDYFKKADQALVSVHIPTEFEAPRKTLQMSAPDIVQTFVKANPGMSKASLAAVCSGPELSEVRVCMDKNLKIGRAHV